MSSYVYIFAPFLLVAILAACSSAYCVYIYFSTRKLSRQIRAQMLARIIHGSQSNFKDINVSNKYRPWRLTSLMAENPNKANRFVKPQEEAQQSSTYMNPGEGDCEQHPSNFLALDLTCMGQLTIDINMDIVNPKSHVVQELPAFDQRPVEIQKQRHPPQRYLSESMVSSDTRSGAPKDIRGRTDSHLSRYSDENYHRQELHQGYRSRSDARPGRAIPKDIR
ncbi:hypothetical protein PHET_03095 [Paragonimus heterotremus]|uniref:Uncharacterized protein n=1 Tax=Paragonimus heterotremus TaxID=100268 RepID=A0A8J4WK22_9TREM|nr:hypothetical protein PHET_03095 [Paragonimus heterotremus]